MFDVKSKAGTLIILINTRHPARDHFFDLLKRDESAGTGRKQILEDARQDWGRLARDFLQAANE